MDAVTIRANPMRSSFIVWFRDEIEVMFLSLSGHDVNYSNSPDPDIKYLYERLVAPRVAGSYESCIAPVARIRLLPLSPDVSLNAAEIACRRR
jgi:hypothetical protein